MKPNRTLNIRVAKKTLDSASPAEKILTPHASRLTPHASRLTPASAPLSISHTENSDQHSEVFKTSAGALFLPTVAGGTRTWQGALDWVDSLNNDGALGMLHS